MKKLLVFFVPASILIITYFLLPHMAALKPSHLELAQVSPYIVAALGMFLAVHFHRGRPFLALLLLVLFYWFSRTILSDDAWESLDYGIYQAFLFLVPLNFSLFAFMRERGVFTVAGRLRMVFLLIQGGGAFWLFARHQQDVIPYVSKKYSLLPFLDSSLIPQTAMLLGLFCLAVIALIALRRQSPIESGMLGALAAFFIACNWLTDSDINTAFCAAGALVITQSILLDSYNMAFRDDLTGIPSRRALNESLNGLGRRYVIAMLDVDHFKKFNDNYGHDVGDQVLKMVARKIMDVGGGGKAFRYGGEEFAVLFHGSRLDDVMPHLEELRMSVAGYSLALRSDERPKEQSQGRGQRGSRRDLEHVSVTISIGVAESGDEHKTKEMVLRAADKALYKSKSRGRNLVSR